MYEISVIIPTYKRSSFIIKSIQSVLNQKNVKCEIIVIDDNGLNTIEQVSVYNCIKEYINSGLVKYIPHKTNMNGSNARNTGIKNSTFDYIAFLDDDDDFLDDKLYYQIQQMEIDGNSACLCGFQRHYENYNDSAIFPSVNDEIGIEILSLKTDLCAGSCLLVKKSILIDVGLFDTSFARHQDLEFLYRLSKVTKISLVKKNLVRINMHNENIKQKPGINIEKYRMHFLDTFKNDILNFDLSKQNYIYDSNYIEISKAYIKEFKVNKFIYWIMKTSNPLSALFQVLEDIIVYLRKGLVRKYAKEISKNHFIS